MFWYQYRNNFLSILCKTNKPKSIKNQFISMDVYFPFDKGLDFVMWIIHIGISKICYKCLFYSFTVKDFSYVEHLNILLNINVTYSYTFPRNRKKHYATCNSISDVLYVTAYRVVCIMHFLDVWQIISSSDTKIWSCIYFILLPWNIISFIC